MKVNEYLSSKRAAGELLERKYKRASKKFPLTTILFCILIAGLLFGATKLPRDPSEAISSDSFMEYERTMLGNTVTNTLNNGIVADNALGHSEETDDGIKVIGKNGECLLPANSSNINITDKGAYFRDNDNIVYCFLKYGESYKDFYKEEDKNIDSDTENGTEDNAEDSDKKADKKSVIAGQTIFEGPCGNCIVSNNNTLYMINFSKDSHVYSYDLNGKNGKEIINEPVRSFAVLENSIFYLDYNNNLVKLDDSGNKEYSLENVDKFYLNGNLFIQNNDKVVSVNLNNENGEVIADGIEELLGVTNSSLYYLKDNKVYERSIEGGNEKVLDQGKTYYDGVYNNNGNIIAIGEDL